MFRKVNIPEKRITFEEWARIMPKGKMLGQGFFAYVYESNKPGRVIKVEDGNTLVKSGYEVFLSYALAYQSNPHFPRIYSAVKYIISDDTTPWETRYLVVEMERLSPSTRTVEKTKHGFTSLYSYHATREVPRFMGYMYGWTWKRDTAPLDKAWMQARAILRHIYSHEGRHEDLQLANIMLRGNTIVITDPAS